LNAIAVECCPRAAQQGDHYGPIASEQQAASALSNGKRPATDGFPIDAGEREMDTTARVATRRIKRVGKLTQRVGEAADAPLRRRGSNLGPPFAREAPFEVA
jgi:hypothetical protein